VAGDAVFAALADPTRRRVVERLAAGGATTASSLAAELPVSRQAVAKHLGILADARLVSSRRIGRENRYTLSPAPLSEAARWIARVGGEWDERLARLERILPPNVPQ
jgi:DNA-binding transcriptional ArsR family regulator